MRVLPFVAIMAFGLTVGLTANVAAQMLGPGMPVPGAAPQQQQLPPCFKDFAPLRAEAEKRANILKNAMQKRPEREVACNLIKSFAQAESAVVKFIQKNAEWCGIPPQAATQMKTNHDRTLKTQGQICNVAAAAPAKPTGPGLSEALGTSRSPSTLDPLAPKSGTLDTLTGNVLTR
jgi:hypothetical protein